MSKFCEIFRCLAGETKLRLQVDRKERKTVLVRIVSQYFSSMMENSSNINDCEITGLVHDMLPLFPKILGYNCTAFVDFSGGPMPSGNHSGIIGHFQADNVDFSPVPFRVPLEDDPVAIGHVAFSDKISFSTVYVRSSSPIADRDLMTFFQHVDYEIWIIFSLIIVFVSFILRLQGDRNPLFHLIQCFLQTTGRQSVKVSSRILGWTLLIGFFVISVFYANFILSDLVRQEKPSVLQYFFDVLNPEAEIFFSKDNQMFNELQRSADPRMSQIVQKATKKGIEKITLKEGMVGFSEFIGSTLSRNKMIALFGKSNMIEKQRLIGCSMIWERDDIGNYSMWVPEDSPHQWVLATPFNKNLDTATKDVIDKAVVQFAERGMYGSAFWYRLMSVVKAEMFKGKADPLCYSPNIVAEDPEAHESLSLMNTKFLFIILAVVTLFGLVILTIEKLSYSNMRARKRKSLLANPVFMRRGFARKSSTKRMF
ncbi:hypothetical protein HDE_02084 [Halotydeus destructor]|nr:hypothetical protein HDE_02084 [Halotydeus destructor]